MLMINDDNYNGFFVGAASNEHLLVGNCTCRGMWQRLIMMMTWMLMTMMMMIMIILTLRLDFEDMWQK